MVNFNPIDKNYIVRWQSDLENTKESILPVCDKPYHKIKALLPLWGGSLKNVELSIAQSDINLALPDMPLIPEHSVNKRRCFVTAHLSSKILYVVYYVLYLC